MLANFGIGTLALRKTGKPRARRSVDGSPVPPHLESQAELACIPEEARGNVTANRVDLRVDVDGVGGMHAPAPHGARLPVRAGGAHALLGRLGSIAWRDIRLRVGPSLRGVNRPNALRDLALRLPLGRPQACLGDLIVGHLLSEAIGELV